MTCEETSLNTFSESTLKYFFLISIRSEQKGKKVNIAMKKTPWSLSGGQCISHIRTRSQILTVYLVYHWLSVCRSVEGNVICRKLAGLPCTNKKRLYFNLLCVLTYEKRWQDNIWRWNWTYNLLNAKSELFTADNFSQPAY